MSCWIDIFKDGKHFVIHSDGEKEKVFDGIDAALEYLRKQFKPYTEVNSIGKEGKEDHSNRLVIKTKKIVVRGVKKRKITKVEGVITGGDLPIKYTEERPFLDTYGVSSALYIFFKDDTDRQIKEGMVYNKERWDEEILPAIKEAGERLHNIRKEVKKAEKEWCGEETFVI